MTQQLAPQTRPLCPHLAAAVLWMTKPAPPRPHDGKIRYARAYGRVIDDVLAL
jgi:hypothetical protein